MSITKKWTAVITPNWLWKTPRLVLFDFLSFLTLLVPASLPVDTSRECVDQPHLANCDLILQAQLCNNEYYSSFCCASCSRRYGWVTGCLPFLQPYSRSTHLQSVYQAYTRVVSTANVRTRRIVGKNGISTFLSCILFCKRKTNPLTAGWPFHLRKWRIVPLAKLNNTDKNSK